MNSPKVYEGDEIYAAFGKHHYYQSFLIKTKITDLELYEKGESFYFRIPLFKDGISVGSCPIFFDAKGYWNSYKTLLNEGDEYIMSVYHHHHDQVLAAQLLQIHFNVTKREMVRLWHWEQDSNHYHPHYKNMYRDENGMSVYPAFGKYEI